jgi:hypothetical protein
VTSHGISNPEGRRTFRVGAADAVKGEGFGGEMSRERGTGLRAARPGFFLGRSGSEVLGVDVPLYADKGVVSPKVLWRTRRSTKTVGWPLSLRLSTLVLDTGPSGFGGVEDREMWKCRVIWEV